MCSRRPLKFLSWWLPLILLLVVTSAHATEIQGAAWNGSDFVIYCSDSTGYHIDLATSDSSQLVIYIDATLAPQLRALGAFSGPNNLQTIVTEATQGGVRLSVIAQGRMGYSTLWRPYSHRLIIHTFLWNALSYTTEQYHKGLLALEQGLDRQAEEFLGISFATGEDRAGSALGVRYEQRGADSLALRYLLNPLDADDYAALANIHERAGDTKAASMNRQSFRTMLDRGVSVAMAQIGKKDVAPTSNKGITLLSNPSVVAIIVGVLLVLMVIVTWVIRRSSHIDHQKSADLDAAVPADITQVAADTPTPVVEVPTRKVPEPVSRIEPSIQVSRPQFWSPDIVPPTDEPKPWMTGRSAPETPVPAPSPEIASKDVSAENPFLSKQPEKLGTPEIANPVQPSKTKEPEAESRTTSGVSAFELRSSNEKFDVALKSDEAAAPKPATKPTTVRVPLSVETPLAPTEATAAPVEAEAAVVETTAAPLEATAAPAESVETPAEPVAPKHKLSVQAQMLQQKIKSHRPNVPAPAEPTVSAARRLNLSRDNVELRKMMEQAAGKRERVEN